jgi:hypothetical protein
VDFDEDGARGWSIELAELFRIFPAVSVERAETRAGEQAVIAPDTEAVSAETPETPVQALQLRVAVLEAELAAERRRAEDLRTDRNRWADQAQRLALPAPAVSSGFLGRLFGRKVA